MIGLQVPRNEARSADCSTFVDIEMRERQPQCQTAMRKGVEKRSWTLFFLYADQLMCGGVFMLDS
eukprot:408482-Rhodomonas_salina.1